MRTLRIMLLVALLAGVAGAAAGEGGYTGMGWCPVCGRDMPQSHFPHRVEAEGTGGGGGEGIIAYHLRHHREVVGWYNDGVAAYNKGNYAQAEGLFRRVAGSPFVFESKVWRMLGLSLEMQGRGEEALTEYARAVAKNPLDVQAGKLHKSLAVRLAVKEGQTLEEQGRLEEAAKKFRHAREIDPWNENAQAGLARVEPQLQYARAGSALRAGLTDLAAQAAKPAPAGAARLEPVGESHFQKPAATTAVDARERWVMRDAPAPLPSGKAAPAASQQPPARERGAAAGETLFVRYGLLTRHGYTGGWPGPVGPDPRLPNPLSREQAVREEALAGPLDKDRLARLDLVQALAVLAERYHAATDRAARGAGDDLAAQLAALRQAGRIPAADLLGAARTDPAVRDAVREAVAAVAGREARAVREAGDRLVADLADYLRVRDPRVLGERKVSEAVDRLRADHEQTLAALARQTRGQIEQAHEPLLKEGLWERGQDPYAKAVGDIGLQGRLYDAESPVWRRHYQQEAALRAAFHQKLQQILARGQVRP